MSITKEVQEWRYAQVEALLIRNAQHREIAKVVGISENTVTKYSKRIYAAWSKKYDPSRNEDNRQKFLEKFAIAERMSWEEIRKLRDKKDLTDEEQKELRHWIWLATRVTSAQAKLMGLYEERVRIEHTQAMMPIRVFVEEIPEDESPALSAPNDKPE